jgi:hypothetical protein
MHGDGRDALTCREQEWAAGRGEGRRGPESRVWTGARQDEKLQRGTVRT